METVTDADEEDAAVVETRKSDSLGGTTMTRFEAESVHLQQTLSSCKSLLEDPCMAGSKIGWSDGNEDDIEIFPGSWSCSLIGELSPVFCIR